MAIKFNESDIGAEAFGGNARRQRLLTAARVPNTKVLLDRITLDAGAIIDRFIREGLRIVALKMTKLSADKAGEFYAIHKERGFYGELVEFMSSGPIIAAILEKENAVSAFRDLIGATNPAQAAEGSIRKLYATSVGENAVHGSDSNENAKIECDFFFSSLERF